MKFPFDKKRIIDGMSFQTYYNLTDQLVAEGKTTGPKQTEDLAHYTKLNLSRMKRLAKTASLNDALIEKINQVKRKTYFLVISEAWCGDAAQNVPLIAKATEFSSNIEIKIILRDENLDIMDAFLTNGGRSIPKVIAIDAESLEVIGKWGPRPQAAQKLMLELKAKNAPYAEISERLQRWYIEDKTNSFQADFLELIESTIKGS
ncbi:thioredoxin family protein [Vicingaceae bacterium]|nr:thioredoxin family protein [Vicingaceae bacterium]